MSQIQIPNIRQGTDVTIRATLSDSGVHVDWSEVSEIAAYIYSEDQRQIAGKCSVEVDPLDSEVLICEYPATAHQWLGVQSLVIVCDYDDQHCTFDKKAFAFVATTDETASTTTVEDETVEVDIDVTDVDSSILSAAIRAALEAADLAEEKAEYADEQGDYAKQQGDYAKDQGDYAKQQGDYAKDKGDYADAKGDYAKEQGDYAKDEIDGAKGDFESLDARFTHTEEISITLEETETPADAQLLNEYSLWRKQRRRLMRSS